MRVRISYTVEVDDDFRRGIRRYYGKGLATRQEVKDWCERYGNSEDDNIAWQEQQVREGESS